VVSTRDDEAVVRSRFLVHRSRLADEVDLFIGRREDVLRTVDGAWKIARRTVLLDQNVLQAKNLTIFF
jgi:biphenyl 2,3-dioxygenase beta subunit